MGNLGVSRSSLLSRVLLTVIPVLIIGGFVMALGVQQQTVSQFVLYLSAQEQLERFTPRQQVLLSFYADRITSTLPFAGTRATLSLVDIMANTLGTEMVVARNTDRFYVSSGLRGMDGTFVVTTDGVLRGRLEDTDSGRSAELEITPVLTSVVTPFTADEDLGEDVARFFGVPELFEEFGTREQEFLTQTTIIVFLYTLATVVVVGLLLAVLLARNLRPLRSLAQATRLSGGGAPPQVPEEGPREIRELTGSFNEMSAQLFRAEQSRQRMITDVSHELRGPIGNLRAEVEAIQDGLARPDRAAIESLHEEVLLLTRLVDDLNELALADAHALPLVPRAVPAAALVRDVAERFRAQCSAAGRTLELRVDPSLPVLTVDHQRLGQTLLNLLSNSLRYAPKGSTILVTAHSIPRAVLVRVCDTGPGVADEELDQIFDRFYRTDASRNRYTGGSGLGLAISRAIVRAHGGTIVARHNEPHGLCVEMQLPA